MRVAFLFRAGRLGPFYFRTGSHKKMEAGVRDTWSEPELLERLQARRVEF
jgi:hypothetical protein